MKLFWINLKRCKKILFFPDHAELFTILQNKFAYSMIKTYTFYSAMFAIIIRVLYSIVEIVHGSSHSTDTELCTKWTVWTTHAVCTEKLKPLHTTDICQKRSPKCLSKSFIVWKRKGEFLQWRGPPQNQSPPLPNLEYIISMYQYFLSARQVEPIGY